MSALALGSHWLAFLADVTPRRGVGLFRSWGEAVQFRVPAPSSSGIAPVRAGRSQSSLNSRRTKVLTRRVPHETLTWRDHGVREGPPHGGHTGTFQVNFIQMTIWIGYTTSLFLILFIENDKIHQSLAIKQIKWI